MYEIINESTSKLWILAPVIAIGIILYITIAIIEKQRLKLDSFEDNLEKDYRCAFYQMKKNVHQKFLNYQSTKLCQFYSSYKNRLTP